MKNHFEPFLFVLVAAAAAVGGCNRETRVPVFPVTGKVTFQGKAPAGAQVVLVPVNGASAGATGVAPTAIVQSDGTFSVTSYEPEDGAPAGDYVATIQWYKVNKDIGGPGPNVIPKQYATAATSPVKVSVNAGPTALQPITIR
jgi:hypothetical protein